MPREPPAVAEPIRLAGIAVNPLVDGVEDPLVVPPPAFERARVHVFDPAHFLTTSIERLLLPVVAHPRPHARIADDVIEGVDAGTSKFDWRDRVCAGRA